MRALHLALIAALFVAPAVARAVEPRGASVGPRIVSLPGPYPGEPGSSASAVSGDGTVVIGHAPYPGDGNWWRAFRWSAESGMRAIGPKRTIESRAMAVSGDGGVVVGWSRSHDNRLSRAFRWTERKGARRLPGRGARHAQDVSADGSVVLGEFWVFKPVYRIGPALWRHGRRDVRLGEGFGAMALSADGSVAVGFFEDDDGDWTASRWTEAAGLVDLGGFGGEQAGATAVSADGSVLAGFAYQKGRRTAVRWTQAEGAVPLGNLTPQRDYVHPFAMSALGETIVGVAGADARSADRRAVVWTAQRGLEEVSTYLLDVWDLDVAGWTLIEATGVSDDGRVLVGNGYAPGSSVAQAWVATRD